jgi:hypothetical protein
MKKTTNKTSQHRKLVLRREAITVLTPPQLTKVPGGDPEGGCTYYSGCPPWETYP